MSEEKICECYKQIQPQQPIDLIELERNDEALLNANDLNEREDCPFFRALDCDIIFALLFTLVIGCLLIMIIIFWLGGVTQYQE